MHMKHNAHPRETKSVAIANPGVSAPGASGVDEKEASDE